MHISQGSFFVQLTSKKVEITLTPFNNIGFKEWAYIAQNKGLVWGKNMAAVFFGDNKTAATTSSEK